MREAITAANNNADYNDCAATGYGDDAITFSVSGTIALSSQLPNITGAAGLTIVGPAGGITVSGGNAVRVFQVDTGATLNLQNLTVANGRANSGGGIYNSGTLNMTHCTFSGNNSPSAVMGTGGGAINNHGTATATHCTFSNNSATMVGGGIFNRHGALTVTNSTFSGNQATDGGGILNDANATVTNSTFAGNSATANGGSISNSAMGTATVTNSTFSGNSATSSGGGIYNLGSMTLYNTIVANSPAGGSCGGAITNGGNNIDDGTTCGWGSTNGSMSGANPQLGALADNGGATQTMALLTNSPAINGVTHNAPNGCPDTDQRGIDRPIGPRCDIGAYESEYGFRIYLPCTTKSY